jgi:hypothetical protein
MRTINQAMLAEACGEQTPSIALVREKIVGGY